MIWKFLKKLYDKGIDASVDRRMKEVKEYCAASKAFNHQLQTSESAIKAFNMSGKTPGDLKNLFVTLAISRNLCFSMDDAPDSWNSNVALFKWMVEVEMYRRILDLIDPQEAA